MSLDESFRVDVGRADGGRTFVRVIHIPTGKNRQQVGLNGDTVEQVAKRLATELMHDQTRQA